MSKVDLSFRSRLDGALVAAERLETTLMELQSRSEAAERDESCCEACNNPTFAGVSDHLAVITAEIRAALRGTREAANRLAAADDEISVLTHEQQASM